MIRQILQFVPHQIFPMYGNKCVMIITCDPTQLNTMIRLLVTYSNLHYIHERLQQVVD